MSISPAGLGAFYMKCCFKRDLPVSVTSGHLPEQYIYIQVAKPSGDCNSLCSGDVYLLADVMQ